MTKSIFLPHRFNPSYFSAAGFSVNVDPQVRSDFVYSLYDAPEMFSAIKSFGEQHGVTVPNYDLCDKQRTNTKYVNAGFSTLATVAVTSRASLENFPHDPVILKPSVSFNTSSRGHTLDDAMYCVRTKAELLGQLDTLGAFTGSLIVDEPFIAQQVADGADDKYAALILSGVVNGQGAVWHCPPLELDTYFKDKVRTVKSVWSEENNTEEALALQRCVDNLLAAENTKNCFYQLQFLRAGDCWVPHDFQFRMTYYVYEYLGMPRGAAYTAYKNALVKYAFDAAIEKPALPTNFGLSFYPNTNPDMSGTLLKTFVTGSSKAEVLSTLEAM